MALKKSTTVFAAVLIATIHVALRSSWKRHAASPPVAIPPDSPPTQPMVARAALLRALTGTRPPIAKPAIAQ